MLPEFPANGNHLLKRGVDGRRSRPAGGTLKGVEDVMDTWSGWMDKLDEVLTDLRRPDK
jgi:hypothetical protein